VDNQSTSSSSCEATRIHNHTAYKQECYGACDNQGCNVISSETWKEMKSEGTVHDDHDDENS
jgi:hypothetical protein